MNKQDKIDIIRKSLWLFIWIFGSIIGIWFTKSEIMFYFTSLYCFWAYEINKKEPTE